MRMSYAAHVTEDDEATTIDKLVVELGQRFPGVPRPVVERLVTERFREFEGAPVRDYIPVMVKRSARESLNSMIADSRSKFERHF
jgi:hypothetical protein